MSAKTSSVANSGSSAPTRIYSMRSLFTNNARVYYKPHSLSAGGIGGVRNARHKHRKT